MTTQKLDLNKIRDEIDKEKQSRINPSQPSHLGEPVGTGAAPRDVFLHGLMESLNKGVATPASTLVKSVDNAVAEKQGEKVNHNLNETRPAVNNNAPQRIEMSPDRDEQLFKDIAANRKQTLAESISGFNGAQNTPTQQPTADFNGTQYLTSAPQQATATNPQTSVSQPMQINEAALVENVKNVVNGYLTENLGSVFQEAIKGTIIEMYAVERIQEVLNENKDLIKSVVVETIREIQQKNKVKKK